MAGQPGRPQVPEGIGQTPDFVDCGLSLVSHSTAEFTADENRFEINMKADAPLKVATELVQFKNAKPGEKVKGGVFNQQDKNNVKFHVHVPETGWYKLNIFAKAASQEGASLPGVFTYLFYVKSAAHWFTPFPKELADFGDGCYLYSPLGLDPNENLSKVHFKLKINPPSRRVAVKAQDEWTHLKKPSPNDEIWEGDVNLEGYKGRNIDITVNANSGPDETRFATLLIYPL